MKFDLFKIGKFIFWIVVFGFIFLELTSCGTFNKAIHKTSKDSVSVNKTEEIKSTNSVIDTKSVDSKTITEFIDTILAPKTITASINQSLNNIPRDTFYISNGVKILQHFDKTRNILTINTEYTSPPEHIYINKKTTEKTDKEEKKKIIDKTDIKNNTKLEVSSKTKEKEVKIKSGWNMFWFGFGSCFVLVLIIKFGYKYLKTIYPWLP